MRTTEQKLLDRLDNLNSELLYVQSDIKHMIRSLENTFKEFNSGKTVNSLGLVQSTGTLIDNQVGRLCAIKKEIDFLNSLVDEKESA